MCQPHGMRRIVHADDRQSTVTPRAIGDGISNDRMVKGNTAPRPGWSLSTRAPPARYPPPPGLLWIGRIDHVDDEQNVIGVTLQWGRRVRVSTTVTSWAGSSPSALAPTSFKRRVGTCVVVPRGVLHGLVSTSPNPVRYLLMLAPGHMSGYFQELVALIDLPARCTSGSRLAVTDRRHPVLPRRGSCRSRSCQRVGPIRAPFPLFQGFASPACDSCRVISGPSLQHAFGPDTHAVSS